MISETETDASFPFVQFYLDVYATSYRLDRNENGSGILLYIRGDAPSRLVISDLSIGAIFIETKLKKRNSTFAALTTLTRT